MLIDGKEYNINILILLMKGEEDVTVMTVETLLESIEEGVTVSILMNGGHSDRLAKLFAGVEAIRYYESPVNLGIPGGRNFLFDTDECRSCDIVMPLDNDVVVPLDYVRSLATFLVRNRDAGFVGGVGCDIHYIDYAVARHYGHKGTFGGTIFRITSPEIKEYTFRDMEEFRIYHMGTYHDYDYAYFSGRQFYYAVLGKLLAMAGIRKSFNTALKFRPEYHEMLREGVDRFQVTNIGGGMQAFRRSLIEEIGTLNEVFNPVGQADVEFCIRAIRAGYRNYTDTNTWFYHGTDTRHKERDPLKVAETYFRNRTILTGLVYPGRLKRMSVMASLFVGKLFYHTLRQRYQLFGQVASWIRGIRRGNAELEARAEGAPEAYKGVEVLSLSGGNREV